MSADTLSEVLQAVRLRGAVFFTIDATAPWVLEAPASREIGAQIMPGAEHVIEYHVIISGSGWGGMAGAAPARLEAGDILAFPHGDAHVLSSESGMRGVLDVGLFQRARTGRLPMTIELNGGTQERFEVICGFLGCDARPFNPLLAALPRMLHVARPGAEDRDVLQQFVKVALRESRAQRPGSEAVLARLSELLFVDVVRRYLSTLPAENVGWLAGLRDEGIGRALGKLHEQPERDWTLEELARAVGVSRSVLAERFNHFVGVPPMQYLAQWRMQLAATLLSTTTLSLLQVAERVGYGSETALSRAYKRWVGVAPAEWRRGKRRIGARMSRND